MTGKDKVAADRLTLICAHRGYWRDVPENTLEAVQAALDLNAETIELDVRLTHDGVPVLMHDWALDRTTSGSGFVADWPAQHVTELVRRDGAGQPTNITVPTLEDALVQLYKHNARQTADAAQQRGYVLVLDVKDKHDARAVDSYRSVVAAWQVVKAVQADIDAGKIPVNGIAGPKINIADAIVIKVLARELPLDPAEYQRELPAIRGVGARLFPIVYFQDLGDPTTPEGQARNARWDAYLAANTGDSGVTSVVSYEIVRPCSASAPLAQIWGCG